MYMSRASGVPKDWIEAHNTVADSDQITWQVFSTMEMDECARRYRQPGSEGTIHLCKDSTYESAPSWPSFCLPLLSIYQSLGTRVQELEIPRAGTEHMSQTLASSLEVYRRPNIQRPIELRLSLSTMPMQKLHHLLILLSSLCEAIVPLSPLPGFGEHTYMGPGARYSSGNRWIWSSVTGMHNVE